MGQGMSRKLEKAQRSMQLSPLQSGNKSGVADLRPDLEQTFLFVANPSITSRLPRGTVYRKHVVRSFALAASATTRSAQSKQVSVFLRTDVQMKIEGLNS